MSLNDSISNMLTLIRNGCKARLESIDVPSTNTIRAIADILKQERYIENCRFSKDGKQGILRIYLKYYSNKDCAISGLKRISRSGLRIYAKKDKIPAVLRGKGIAIISTSKGIVTDDQARELKVGGEVICYVW
ncbi:MAG: 30S ribosomal protein S8 [Candidatus Omnitrophica bacterium]|nr:30S ribosomal protein S8 [Candidatus Omnitrophota bacterium]MDD5355166.1 30S ribosomal protein S8 [Candidatus Omnitrophota bacterium]